MSSLNLESDGRGFVSYSHTYGKSFSSSQYRTPSNSRYFDHIPSAYEMSCIISLLGSMANFDLSALAFDASTNVCMT